MSKLYSLTQADAQSRADDLHQRMIQGNPAYAGQVQRGDTVKWGDPAQDYKTDTPIGQPPVLASTLWYVAVTQRMLDANILVSAETAKLVPDGQVGTAADVMAFVALAVKT